jgi:hypothetical protein
MPWLIDILVAFALLHVRVDALPRVMEVGDAEREQLGALLTVSVAEETSVVVSA